jgi:hypothetical protein
MAINVKKYIENFLGNPGQNNAKSYGVAIMPINAQGWYWKVIGVHHLTGTENNGNHHIYCDILDAFGRRINGARLKLYVPFQNDRLATIDKPEHEPGTNFPLHVGELGVLSVEGGQLPTESVTGLRIDHADESPGNTWGHHSFYVVFQRFLSDDDSTPEPEEPTEPISEDEIEQRIIKAGQPLIIPLNKAAKFYQIAQAQQLGERLTREYDLTIPGHGVYRAQVYERGILYAKMDEWEQFKVIPREN